MVFTIQAAHSIIHRISEVQKDAIFQFIMLLSDRRLLSDDGEALADRSFKFAALSDGPVDPNLLNALNALFELRIEEVALSGASGAGAKVISTSGCKAHQTHFLPYRSVPQAFRAVGFLGLLVECDPLSRVTIQESHLVRLLPVLKSLFMGTLIEFDF